MALIVEIELTAAIFNGTDTIACTFVYRLKNTGTGATLATKTVPINLQDSDALVEPAEIMKSRVNDAVRWAQWLLMANKASQAVGTKVTSPL